MKGKSILPVLVAIFLMSTRLFSQQAVGQIFYGDSLNGFNQTLVGAQLTAEGLYGNLFKQVMETQKRNFINDKYGLIAGEQAFPQSSFAPIGNILANGKSLGGLNVVNAAPCVNEGFESGTLNGWTVTVGTNANSQTYPTFTQTPTASQTSIMTTPFTDPVVGTIPNSPFSGSKVLRVNNTTTGTAAAVRVQQTFSVTATNYLYDFAYYAVMQDAGGHSCQQTPYMAVRVRNFTGTLQACPNFSIVAPSSGFGGCAGIGATTWTTYAFGTILASNGWQRFSIDLTSYIGQNVTIEAYVAHCSLTGHYGYAYFDSNCGTMDLIVNNTQTLSMLGTTVSPQVQCATTATLTAPSALSPRQWFGPSGSGISGSTVQSISTPVAGNYTLNMSPPGICNPPIQKIINLRFAPPSTLTASPASICTSGSVTSSTITAVGANNYTWSTGTTGSVLVVSPTVTTIYSVTAVTGTCSGVYTVQVNVSPTPTLVISNPTGSACVGGNTTLTVNGANSYTWLPSNTTGSSAVISITATTVYTAIGTSTDGCVGTSTTNVILASTPTNVVAVNLTGSVCAGNAVNMIATGALTFSWYPSTPLVTGNLVSLTPSITTTYTVIGAINTCTGQTTVSVLVDPGPSQTVTSSPTITCPGNTIILTSNAPTATGFTWSPLGVNTSTAAASPTITTVYSVTAVNGGGCRSTYTISPTVAPVPVVTISPTTPSICVGSTVSLVASGGSTYTWNPGAINSATASVSPASTTPYTVTASNGTCSSNGTVTVTVVPLPTITASGTSTICAGQTASLSAIGGSTYTWNPGALTGANVTVSPASTTIYTVTGDQAGCTSIATRTVTVFPNPTITAVASPTAVCPGICSTITPNGAASYTYVPAGPAVCPTVTTTYSITGTSTAGCISTAPGTVSILVNPTPTVVLTAASNSICIGSAATMSATGANAYTWNPGGLTGANVSVSPTITTTYTVTGVSAAGCSGSNTITITVVPLPTITASGTSTICAGQTASLSALGGSTYTWNPGALSGANVTVSPSATTIYTVTGNQAGCTASATRTVTVFQNPTITAVASPTAVCPGVCSTLTPSGASTYSYAPAGPVVCPTITTTYSITGTSTAGCISAAAGTVSVLVNPTPTVVLTAASTSICIGSAASMSATGANAYTWNPGGLTGANVSVSPTVTTTYTVTGASAAGCSGTNTITITVVPLPTITASGTPSICVGQTASLSAIGGSTYTWNPGALSGANVTVSPAATTVYTVTGNQAGCTASATQTVTVFQNPTITAVASPTAVCPGVCSTLTPSGASTYTYAPAGPVVCPTVTTTYSITGTSTAGCVSTAAGTISVIVNPTPTVVLTAASTSVCIGSAATMSATGATAYTWNPGGLTGANVTVNPTITTTYTVTGASGAGCSGTNTITITVVPLPTITASGTSSICVGQTASLSALGGTTYTWNPGALSGANVTVSPAATTVYTVSGTQAGCSASATQTVTVFQNPTITIVATSTAVCPGVCTTLTPSGASSYTYSPAGPVVCPTITSTYSVTGTSTAGCVSPVAGTISIQVNPVPVLTLAASPATICAGSSSSLTATGANSYAWNPGGLTGSNVSVSPAATTVYTVVGTSGAGCSGSQTIQVVVNPIPTVGASANPTVICAGASATLTGTGATSYSWNPGGLTGAAVVVSPTITTTYTLIGSAASCTANATAQVSVNPLPSLSITATPSVVCPGVGSTLTASGASSYTWQPGGTVAVSIAINPTITTTYTVTGASVAGCTATATQVMSVNPNPTIVATAASPTACTGATLNLTASGGNTYTWTPGPLTGSQVAVTINNTTTFTVTSTSSLGCTGQNTVTVTAVPLPTVSATTSSATICLGNCATLTANGASTYTWLPMASTGVTAAVCPTINSTYTVVGLSAAGCPGATVVSVNVTNGPTITAAASPTAICAGGSAVLSANGSSGSYTWNPGALTGATVAVTPTSTTLYTVTGTNALGCPGTETVNLVVNPIPVLTITPASSSICAFSSTTLTASGATNYTWNPGGTTGSVITAGPSSTTTYTILGASAAGCTAQANANLTVVPVPTLATIASPTAVCIGNSSTLSATGASSYTWSTGGTGSAVVVTPTVTTVYTVTGANGTCPSAGTVQVVVNPLPTLSAASNPTAVCPGSAANLTVSGAQTYSWSTGATGTLISVSPTVTTNYIVTGTNVNGCVNSFTVNVPVIPAPVMTLSSLPAIYCVGSTATLSASGGNTYTWNPGALTGANVTVSPAATTVYTVTGASAAGCTSTAQFTLTVLPIPTVVAVANPTAICPGFASTLSANGASTYSWSTGGSGSTIAVTPTLTSTYTVLATAANGCTGSSTVAVSVNTVPVLAATATPTSICQGGTATLSVGGATSYTWQPGNLSGATQVVSPTVTTNYTISGVNPAGCITTTVLSLPVLTTPTVTASSNPTVICAGDVATLTANGATNYTWQPGGLTGTSVTVSPTANIQYTVTGSNGACSALASVNVSVNPIPTLVVSGTPTNICAGSSVTLTASGAGSFTWQPGALTASQVVVNPTVSTTYTAFGSNGTCTTPSTLAITVNSVPVIVPAISNTLVCSGFSSTVSLTGATNYTWQPGSLSGSLQVLAPSSTTSYTITGDNVTGCNGTTVITLSVNPTPTLSASALSATVCQGFTTALSAGGANTYTWNPGNVTGSLVVVTVTANTTYTVTGDLNGCANSATVAIQSIALPTVQAAANPSVLCPGDITTVTATGAQTYTWLPNVTIGATFTDQPSASIVYTVVGLAASGCPNFTTVAVTVVPPPTVAVVANPTAICVGGTATLTASGATTYTWLPGSATGSNNAVSPTATSVYTVNGQSGSCVASATISLVVNPLPTVTATLSANSVPCAGNTITLTASGANTYTWMPGTLTGSNVTDTPTTNTSYTVSGDDANGCQNIAVLNVTVNPLPVVLAVASPTAICETNTVALSGSGASTYTWNPGSQTGASITETPAVTTTYTLSGTDANGCVGNGTVSVIVYPNPTVVVAPNNATICEGTSTTLTATGASNYNWSPGGLTGAVNVVSPTVTTNYTVVGDNGGICTNTYTLDVVVNPMPANVTATVSGTISCAVPSVQLTGATTETNAVFLWNGPAGYTSSLSNPTVTAFGIYTLVVTNSLTGCAAIVTVNVPTDNSIPSLTTSVSGSITCAVPEVTLNAANTTTNPGYQWYGPSSFTSTSQTFTVNTPGTYTVYLTDLTSLCKDSAVISVNIHTNVVVTASITVATCSNGISLNNGTIELYNYIAGDRYDLVVGVSYTGSATYTSATQIPTTGIVTSNLANPTTTTPYTLRIFDAEGCIKDTTLILKPTDCTPRVLGIAKAVSTATLNTDGTYNVMYAVVVANTDADTLKAVALVENLANTFPAPSNYALVGSPIKKGTGGLVLMSGFDGSSQSQLTNPLTSKMAPGTKDTITFTLRVMTNGVFGPFKNTVIGTAATRYNVVVRDSSQNGLNPDPDTDNNPNNNSAPTVITFTPYTNFGITKLGVATTTDYVNYDVTYTLTVHNLGNDTLRNVTLNDSLPAVIKAPATYTVKTAPFATGNLIANPAYNGKTVTSLLLAGSKVSPKSTSSVVFTVSVMADTVSVLVNSARGTANTTLTDISSSNTNPDDDNDLNCNETLDNMPTVVLLTKPVNTPTLFIPQGFSPDGDGVNDLFTIKGAPQNSEMNIVIYNRWGNKVFQHENYNNSWDGRPNVAGTFGKEILPSGTYYYILQIKGETNRTITGFIVLEH